MSFWSGAAGPIIGGLIGAAGANSSNKLTSEQFDKQFNLQNKLAHSGYQIAMADMKKAGLNPILAAKYGPASANPVGLSTFQNVGAAAMQGIQNATNSAKTMQDTENQEQALVNAKIQEGILKIDRLMKGDIQALTNNAAKIAKHIGSLLDLFDKVKTDVAPSATEFGERLHDIQKTIKKSGGSPIKFLWDNLKRDFPEYFDNPAKAGGKTTARGTR